MGDIAGFYSAFGVQLSQDIHERLDHLSVELEFLHFLATKNPMLYVMTALKNKKQSWMLRKNLLRNMWDDGCLCFPGC